MEREVEWQRNDTTAAFSLTFGSSFFFLITSSAVTPYGLSSLHSSFPSGRKHNRGNQVMRVTKSRENDGWARAPVPVTHILTLSGRSLQSQPFHRESFYVTGTRVPFSSCRVSPPSLRSLPSARRMEWGKGSGEKSDDKSVAWILDHKFLVLYLGLKVTKLDHSLRLTATAPAYDLNSYSYRPRYK